MLHASESRAGKFTHKQSSGRKVRCKFNVQVCKKVYKLHVAYIYYRTLKREITVDWKLVCREEQLVAPVLGRAVGPGGRGERDDWGGLSGERASYLVCPSCSG